ncbi:hypothetical protein RJT34_26287 [Clitoria ternatea]|uniref:Protein SDA1 n=1 Tax=Clitoria ternatea TaxID=43366 RepID=A0AAN9F902_CLITE
MKCDSGGYEAELVLLQKQFESLLELCDEQGKLEYSISARVAHDLGERALFLAHVAPFYPNHLAHFPTKLADLLRRRARKLPSGLRFLLARALILLVNRKIVRVPDTLSLFMDLQTLGDSRLKVIAFRHVVHSIRRHHADYADLQNLLFNMLLQNQDTPSSPAQEELALRALLTLCELHRRKVWFDDTTADAICTASLYSAPKIMITALSFLLGYEKIEHNDDGGDDDDDSTIDDEITLSRETLYKANHQGTAASKKKKKAKLQRVIRSMKKQQRRASQQSNNSHYSPLNCLKDAWAFAMELFNRLKTCHERYEVKMMMMKVIALTIGLHRLILPGFYSFLQIYIQPYQRDITNLLAVTAQSCHDKVPPQVVEPLFKKIVERFVHDHSRPEAIAVGLSAVREICMRMPLLMNADLLQDLALYKKSHEKAVSTAARSLIALFREVSPQLLVKKDRGRPIDPKARPMAYGKINVLTDVPGAELLQIIDNDDEQESGKSDDSVCSDSDNDQENGQKRVNDEHETKDDHFISEDEYERGCDYETDGSDVEDYVEGMKDDLEDIEEADEVSECKEDDGVEAKSAMEEASKKRKFADLSGPLMIADSSLRALKKLAGTTGGDDQPESKDGILSEKEDFKRINELKVHEKRKKHSKEERLARVRAGREERGKYQARTAVKQKKTGGLSNRQKERKKRMPLAAKRDQVARSRIVKTKKNQCSAKQFRGRKAWK